MSYIICVKCNPHHYTNCKTCFGFGVYFEDKIEAPVPIPSSKTEEYRWKAYACPECSSTVMGFQMNKSFFDFGAAFSGKKPYHGPKDEQIAVSQTVFDQLSSMSTPSSYSWPLGIKIIANKYIPDNRGAIMQRDEWGDYQVVAIIDFDPESLTKPS